MVMLFLHGKMSSSWNQIPDITHLLPCKLRTLGSIFPMPVKNAEKRLLHVPPKLRMHAEGVLVGLVGSIWVITSLSDIRKSDSVAARWKKQSLRPF